MSFKPMYDLESLTEEQRQEYYLNACEHFQVSPELNLLAFIWLDSGDGKRTLTLYAKKGATDIIRGNLGISTTKLTKDVGDGYIAWIVEGRDRNGRIEQAVGSASTSGLKGEALAKMVMIAQTRATRRMTLQFAGGGILDESEVNTAVTDINRASGSLASLATLPMPPAAPVQPSVKPNAEKGNDITPILDTDYPGLSKVTLKESTITLFKDGDITPKTVETVGQVVESTEYPTFSELAKKITDPVVLAAADALVKTPEPVKKRRGRRRKSEITFDLSSGVDNRPSHIKSAGIASSMEEYANMPVIITADMRKELVKSQQAATPEPALPTAESAKKELAKAAAQLATNTALDAIATQHPDASVFVKTAEELTKSASLVDKILEPEKVDSDQPTDAELKAWRARLFVYTNDILPSGGMIKEEGIIWKVRKYVQFLFPELPVKNGTVKLSNKQWEALFAKLENICHVSGPVGLVNEIEKVAAKA